MSSSPEKILILGGSHFQIPPIKYARSAGYHVITCDYLPDNPGHKYAHEYCNVSTTDREGVLSVARRLQVDGVLAYASDPAAPTAAYVASSLGLPSNPYESVRILANKDLYRGFLSKHGFHVPRTWNLAREDNPRRIIPEMTFPVMVKPVDSSGSKGVSKVSSGEGILAAVEHAMHFSRREQVIVEEYIVQDSPQIGGEAFVLDGKLVFLSLGDQIVDPHCNPYVPAGMLFPSGISTELYARIASDLQKLLDLLNLSFGGLNLEIMVDRVGHSYLMEVGPRTGGNFLPELMRYYSGVDIARYSVETALGHVAPKLPTIFPSVRSNGFFAYYAIHSRTCGILHSVCFDDRLRPHILEVHEFKRRGDKIKAFNGSHCTIGIVLLGFDTREQMQDVIGGMCDYVRAEVAPDTDLAEESTDIPTHGLTG